MYEANTGRLTRPIGRGMGLRCGWSAVGGQCQSAYVRGGIDPNDQSGGHSVSASVSVDPQTDTDTILEPRRLVNRLCSWRQRWLRTDIDRY